MTIFLTSKLLSGKHSSVTRPASPVVTFSNIFSFASHELKWTSLSPADGAMKVRVPTVLMSENWYDGITSVQTCHARHMSKRRVYQHPINTLLFRGCAIYSIQYLESKPICNRTAQAAFTVQSNCCGWLVWSCLPNWLPRVLEPVHGVPDMSMSTLSMRGQSSSLWSVHLDAAQRMIFLMEYTRKGKASTNLPSYTVQ